jgi:two-component system, NtrC family, nitrogen regulation sensor histidine kinase NtrY
VLLICYLVKSQRNGFLFWGFPWFLLAGLLYLSIFGIRIYFNIQNTPHHLYLRFQKELLAIESVSKSRVEFLFSNFDTILQKQNRENIEFDEENNNVDELSLFVYKKDSLVYWNNNKVIIPKGFNKVRDGTSFARHLKNGWYGFQCRQMGSYSFIGSYLIKTEFPFQNEFVNNQFSPRFKIPVSVSLTADFGQFPIYARDRTYLFSLSFDQYQQCQDGLSGLILLLFIIGSLCLFYFLFLVFSGLVWLKTRQRLFVLIYCTSILFLRIVQAVSGFPSEVYHSQLFGPAWYSSSAFLPSLGDFTVNVLMLLVMTFVFSKKESIQLPSIQKQKSKSIFPDVVSVFFLFLFFHAVGYFITDLVRNSSISLNLQNIAGLTYESGFGLLIIAALFVSFWLVSSTVLDIVLSKKPSVKWLMLNSFVVAGTYSLICWLAGWTANYIITLFFLGYLVCYWYFKVNQKSVFSLQNMLFLLCFYSVFATFLLNTANKTKETEKLNLYAVKLVTRGNPVTEVFYEQLERRLLVDSIFNQWINFKSGNYTINQDSLVNYLKAQYFNDYWKKYQVQITCCDQEKELLIQPQGYRVNCNAYFRGIINSYGKATTIQNLYFLDYGFGKEYYLGIISRKPFEKNPEVEPAIFIEFNLKNAYPDPGYPALLMDKSRTDLPNLSDYSYGLFQNGRLVRAVGGEGYRMELDQYKEFSMAQPFFREGQMVHFHYRINDKDSLLISKKDDPLLSFAMPFSYLFILFSLITLLISGVVNFPKKIIIFPASLRNRLQFALIGILMVTMVATGIVQVINILKINSAKNIDNLRERAYSVVVEVQHKFSSLKEMQEVTKSELEDFLIKLSNVFFTDINVFSGEGRLIASSRPQIFEEGLMAERMNSQAFRKLIVEKESVFIHYEAIGSMRFNSAYLPFYNGNNQLLGFVNLPYFAKQDESQKEISSFLVTFLNIYILLILFGVFITLLISNHITAPLAMLKEKMSQLRLGRSNEKITWIQNDEIGQLVSDYNRMIDELGKSAEMLAKSERESAWREMARQVAHEIKNPLTPMKLSVQYLEKAWKENAPDWDQRLSRFTKNLVEQIDALSVIASDFSTFAQMPVVAFTRINLEEVVLFVLSLYQDSDSVRYEFQSEVSDPYVTGDRAQLVRAFTNLLNNAVQAIGDQQGGIVRIHLANEEEHIIVRISDNGCGISADRAQRIFQPDFTTKTSGMGLGLAIVKGIVEGIHGNISFKSEEQSGTTFIIKFPVYVE